jgi:TRAP-type mannitol/chloroaromatic compound transport system substrate-binding protein
MKRREFLKRSGFGLAAGAAAVPALAQAPSVKWRMVSSFPKSLDTIYGSQEELCKRVGELTDGKFEIRSFAAGEIVGGLQVLDAVQAGTVECGQTLSSFYFGKNTAIAFDSGLAFGLNTRQQSAWMYYGGGLELMREVFAQFNCLSMPCGNVGVQMGGWFRKEIKSLKDLKGLKMRIGGMGGLVLAKLGAVPQQIAPSDIYTALEKGTVDAAEWIGPYDDEKLGFYKVAKHYYTPGWWEGSAQITALVNLKQWEALPKPYQAAYEAACTEQNVRMMAKYDTKNPDGMRRLLAQGVKLHAFPRDVMEAAYKTSFELYDELAAKNPDFNKLYASWRKFREDQIQWFRVAENNLDNFTYASAAKAGAAKK